MEVSIIVVADENNGIGKDNQLLCHLPADLKYFKQLTTGHHILMGRKTFESIGKPLPNRTNLIISRSGKPIEGCLVFDTIEAAKDFAEKNKETELFILGGASIFLQCIRFVDTVFLTRIHHHFEADTFFEPLSESQWKRVYQEPHLADAKNAYDYSFETYKRITDK
ncbi:MAG: dihydrofolate reductase [Bacteroidota bacterium]|nr:dihydrofolate reductase [Bacteroidota bacterium]